MFDDAVATPEDYQRHGSDGTFSAIHPTDVDSTVCLVACGVFSFVRCAEVKPEIAERRLE